MMTSLPNVPLESGGMVSNFSSYSSPTFQEQHWPSNFFQQPQQHQPFYANENFKLEPGSPYCQQSARTPSPTGSSVSSVENVKGKKGGAARRYKTPSPQVLRIRRLAANARERKRMDSLNVAFDKLRNVLPILDTGRKFSKFETLQMAQAYINSLSTILTGEEKNATFPPPNTSA